MSRGRTYTIDMHQRSKALAAPPAVPLPLPVGAPLLSEEETAAFINKPDALLAGWKPAPVAAAPPPPAPIPVAAPSLPTSVQEDAWRAKKSFEQGSRYAYQGEKRIRITADLPPALHHALSVHSTDTGIPIRVLVIRGLALQGIVEP